MESYVSSVTEEISNGSKNGWSLLDRHLGWGQISLIEIDDLEDAVRDLCFDCFLELCSERFSWDEDLLKQGFLLKDHSTVKSIREHLSEPLEEWCEMFLDLVRLDRGWDIEKVLGRDSEIWLENLDFVVSVGVSPNEFMQVIDWYESFTGEVINRYDFFELVANGYRCADDLRLLESTRNQERSSITIPPIDLLRKTGGGIDGFLSFDRKMSDVFGDTWDDVESEERFAQIHKLLDMEITERCFDLIDENVKRLSELTNSSFFGEADFDSLPEIIETLRSIGLPITDENVGQYFDLSESAILFSIDNRISDSNFFTCARLFHSVPEIQSAVLMLENRFDLYEIYVLVKAGMTVETVEAVKARGVSLTALAELVAKEPQFPCVALLFWLDAGFEADSLDEMLEWWRAGFIPNNVESWRELGFDALEATAWLRHTSDPVVAWRRKEAGITPI